MNVTVLYNPIAGAGRAVRAASDLADALDRTGHTPHLVESVKSPDSRWLDEHLPGADLLIVVGGDGAMRIAVESAIRTQTPVFHYPMGTENLFARELGMLPEPQHVITAIDHADIRAIDVGQVSGGFGAMIFNMMASIGFDAEVIHDLAANRRGAISHWSYLGPICRQLWAWRPCRMGIEIDGRTLVDAQHDSPGMVLVANSRQYGMRFDPARRASITDNLLDVVWFPVRRRLIDLMQWMWRCRTGRHLDHPALRYERAVHVTVTCDESVRFQLDGDPPSVNPHCSAHRALRFTARPGALRVLIPPHSELADPEASKSSQEQTHTQAADQRE